MSGNLRRRRNALEVLLPHREGRLERRRLPLPPGAFVSFVSLWFNFFRQTKGTTKTPRTRRYTKTKSLHVDRVCVVTRLSQYVPSLPSCAVAPLVSLWLFFGHAAIRRFLQQNRTPSTIVESSSQTVLLKPRGAAGIDFELTTGPSPVAKAVAKTALGGLFKNVRFLVPRSCSTIWVDTRIGWPFPITGSYLVMPTKCDRWLASSSVCAQRLARDDR